MAGITLKNIEKTYEDGHTVIPDLNLEIKDKEFLTLVGPSGCGKSTTLRMIAGLEEITSGELSIGDRVVNHVPPKDRNIAMVFQSYALYPHMTVYKNMAFGLSLRKEKKQRIDEKVHEAARILELEDYLDRKPRALSGGQRQRVALGRAMVRNPSVFLLDEPLSNLDAKLRAEMRSQIIQLHKKLETTFVYVTHDQTEAMTMADRIVVMKDGVIQQADTPQNLYEHPANKFVAGFIGSPEMNFFTSDCIASGNKVTLSSDGFEIILNSENLTQFDKQKIIIGIRPEAFTLNRTNAPQYSSLKIQKDFEEHMGSENYLHGTVSSQKTPLIARIPSDIPIPEQDIITLYFNNQNIHLFDSKTEKRIFL